jgi:guanylate kinase
MNQLSRRGLCLVLSAPSGAGKSSVSRALLEREADLRLSVSATTRQPRPGEQEGVHYHFRAYEEFQRMIAAGELLEHAEVFGRCYGTPRAAEEQALAAGRDELLRQALPGDVVGVFLLPPSLEELERRLHGRGQDSTGEIARRMQAARDEISHYGDFDNVLVNHDFHHTVDQVRAILHASRTTRARQPWLPGFVGGMLRG